MFGAVEARMNGACMNFTEFITKDARVVAADGERVPKGVRERGAVEQHGRTLEPVELCMQGSGSARERERAVTSFVSGEKGFGG